MKKKPDSKLDPPEEIKRVLEWERPKILLKGTSSRGPEWEITKIPLKEKKLRYSGGKAKLINFDHTDCGIDSAAKDSFSWTWYKNKILDYSSLPHFCRKEGSGSTCHNNNGMVDNCFSLDHAYHQQLYSYVKKQAILKETGSPVREGSVHVEFPEPDPDDTKIALTIESELHKLADCNSLNGLKVNR